MEKIHMSSGNLITNIGGNKTDIENLTKALNESFSSYRIAEEEKIVEKTTLDKKQSKIKDHNWERVKGATRGSDTLDDFRAIKPSRSEGESDNGGRSTLASSLNSIWDPNRSENVRNSEYTDHAIQAGEERRRKAENARKGKIDWNDVENILEERKAKSTKDINPTQMGFTPNRSAFEPAPLPKVNVPGVEKYKEKVAESKKAGETAAQLQNELNKIFNDKFEKELNENKSWEDVQHEKLAEIDSKNIHVESEKIRLHPETIDRMPKSSEVNLNSLFEIPQDPKTAKNEDNIKRKSNINENRKKREDDRSWEKVSSPKKTW